MLLHFQKVKRRHEVTFFLVIDGFSVDGEIKKANIQSLFISYTRVVYESPSPKVISDLPTLSFVHMVT